jgi:hypothetical protein
MPQTAFLELTPQGWMIYVSKHNHAPRQRAAQAG